MLATETAVLVLQGALDASGGAALASRLRELPLGTAHLVLDLTDVLSVDAFALGSLLASRRRVAEVTVVGARPAVADALRRAGALALLSVVESDLQAA